MRKWFLLTAGKGYSEVTQSVLADHGSDANNVGRVREQYGPLVAAAPDLLHVAQRLAAWNNNHNGSGVELEAICAAASSAIARVAPSDYDPPAPIRVIACVEGGVVLGARASVPVHFQVWDEDQGNTGGESEVSEDEFTALPIEVY